ncbi:DUF3618 domain-containing protein [Nocardioides sp. AE5]|uniref:DUF3618 domain-containing protein n=1 Tax=Nocardioides sp. AE5 TaxID=2962573 RepID=UPI0028814B32|nr:DUF3618 domain-containing protein [Nocardioides sp. AE5]MDT0203974.1 DUF3618 domain-containing protein [Nocardioides sp. AE5]
MAQEISAIESDLEETRERLAQTIDQLVYRVHPKTIVSREIAAVKAHFVDQNTGAPRTDNILKVVGGVVGVVALFVVVRKVAS